MKKLLFIISTLDTGGAQKIAAEMSLALSKYYDIDILVNDSESISFPYFGKIISLGMKKKINKKSFLYQIHVLRKRIRFIKNKADSYHAIISFLDSANYANILGNNNTKTKTICTIHCALSIDSDWKYKYIVLPLDKELYKKADLIVTVSKGVEYDFIHKVGYKYDNITTIHNGLDLQRIREMAQEQILPQNVAIMKDGFLITTMGRLTHQKGQWHLIRAMKKIVKIRPDAKLIILGEGKLREYLQKLITDGNLEDNIFLIGFEENPYNILAKSDLFVLPSLYEGFGNVLVEAMTLGIPCISSDYEHGAREILAPELSIGQKINEGVLWASYGVLIPVPGKDETDADVPETREESIMSETIIRLMQDDQLRHEYSIKAKQGAERFDMNIIAKQWENVIEAE